MASEPEIDRPGIPAEYGVATDTAGLLPWSHVVRRLTDAPVYWLATIGRSGTPRVRPVDGTFVDGVLYLGGSVETAWVRDLLEHPKVSVHLEGAEKMDVLVLEGEAEHLEGQVPRELGERLAAATYAKYPQYGAVSADSYGRAGSFRIRPTWAVAATDFAKNPTRFRFR